VQRRRHKRVAAVALARKLAGKTTTDDRDHRSARAVTTSCRGPLVHPRRPSADF